MKQISKIATLALAAALILAGKNALATPVSLELALLVDVSGSVNGTEFNLQKTGYVNAFNNSGIQAAIAALPGGIAVTYIEWSSSNRQSIQVGWTNVTDATSAAGFASAISASTRAFSGSTAPGTAINFATPLFSDNGFEAARWVIDVSGDGIQNNGANTATARDNFLNISAPAGEGLTRAINGLPIGNVTLQNWYQDNVVGGDNSFLIAVSDFAGFEDAVLQKIGREIRNEVPEPAPLALLFAGLMAFAFMRRSHTA
ncbi:MAG: DUF1194 domain-containing protein [Nitrosomonas sp.]|nr:DUF1194 domain-containing protein [Nitrosomonas sp.]